MFAPSATPPLEEEKELEPEENGEEFQLVAIAVQIDNHPSPESEPDENGGEYKLFTAELWTKISTITDPFVDQEVEGFKNYFEEKESKPDFIPISIPLCLRVSAYYKFCKEIQQLVRERYCKSGDFLYNSIDEAMEYFKFELDLIHKYNPGIVDLNWSIEH